MRCLSMYRMGRRYLVVAVLVAVASIVTTGGEPGGPGSDRPRQPRVTVVRDIEYVPGGHERQKLDLYLPDVNDIASASKAHRPLIIWVHGGA